MDPAALYDLVRREELRQHTHQFSSLLMCAQERLVYGTAMRTLRRGDRVLDWGCGNGHFSFFLARSGFEVDAYEMSDVPALLRNEPLVRYVRGEDGDPVRLPYASATFDAVFGMGVLEHVHDRPGGAPQASLRELARVLKDGGTAHIFHLPNRWSWLEWAKRVAQRAGVPGQMPHDRLFSRAQFAQCLEGTPFGVVAERRYHIIPRASIASLLGRLRDARAVCAAVDAADLVLAAMLPALCQNWYFELRKHDA
jgi:SAM-dependent methyltransferase